MNGLRTREGVSCESFAVHSQGKGMKDVRNTQIPHSKEI